MNFVMSSEKEHQCTKKLYQIFNHNGKCLIEGAIFFGTPFKGSKIANLVSPFLLGLGNQEAKFATLKTQHKQTKTMLLTFDKLRRDQHTKLLIFYETKLTRKYGVSIPVVKQDSAKGYFTDGDVTRLPLKRAHTSLCRFTNDKDEDFSKFVKPYLIEMVKKIVKAPIADVSPTAGSQWPGDLQTTETPGECSPCTDAISIRVLAAEPSRKLVERSNGGPILLADSLNAPVPNGGVFRELPHVRAQGLPKRVESQAVFNALNLLRVGGRMDDVKSALPGTCDHVLQSQAYRNWLSADASSVLFLRSPSGRGKSVLARHLVATLERERPFVSHFFCRSDSGQTSLELILRHLLYDLATRHPREVDRAAQETKMITGGRLEFPFYLEVFKRMLNNVKFEMVCVIDGLDECVRDRKNSLVRGDDTAMIEFLRYMIQELEVNRDRNQGNLKILATTQPIPEVVKATEDRPNCLMDLDSAALKKSVTRMIESDIRKLAERRGLTHVIEEYLRKEVTRKAGDSFQYAKLVIDIVRNLEITNCGSIDGYEQTLSSLEVEEVGSVYEENLRYILAKGSADDSMVTLTACMLKILVFALDEVSVRDLQYALVCAVYPVDADTFANRIPHALGHAIESHCGALLSVDGERVRFTHSSVRDFLIKLDQEEWPRFSCQNHEEGHEVLAKSCLTFLATWLDIEKRRESKYLLQTRDSGNASTPFLKYAAEFWNQHVAEVQTDTLHAQTCDMLNRAYEQMVRINLKHKPMKLYDHEFVDKDAETSIWQTPPLSVFLARINLADFVLRIDASRMSSWRGRLDRFLKHCVKSTLKVPIDIHDVDSQGRGMLYFAAMHGNLALVKYLLRHGVSARQRAADGETPFFIALAFNHEDVAVYLINTKQYPPEDESVFGSLTLECVIAQEMHTLFPLLIKMRRVTDDGRGRQKSPLYIACECGSLSFVMRLLRRGDDVSECTSDFSTALHAAASEGSLRIVQALFKHRPGLEVSPKDDRGQTPIALAAANGHTEIVMMLMEKSEVPDTDMDGESPLHRAAANGHTATVRVLIRKDQALDVDNDGLSPLHHAAVGGHLSVVELLANHAENNRRSFTGHIPLHLAAIQGHASVVEFFLKAGVSTDLKALCFSARRSAPHEVVYCENVLLCALRSNDEPTIKLLLDSPEIDVHQDLPDGSSTLDRYLIHGGTRAICAELVRHGVRPRTCVSKTGTATTLHIASRCSDRETMEWLLEELQKQESFDINCTTIEGYSAIYIAADTDSVEKYYALLKAGADACKSDNEGVTPFMVAAAQRDASLLRTLLADSTRSGQDKSSNSRCNDTILHYAAKGSIDTFDLCFRSAFDINARNFFGETPLMQAFRLHNGDICKKLLQMGADPTIRDTSTMSIFDYLNVEHALWPIFDPCVRAYKPLSLQIRRQKIRRSIREFFDHDVVHNKIFSDQQVPDARAHHYFSKLGDLFMRYGGRETDARIAMEAQLEVLTLDRTSSYYSCKMCSSDLNEDWETPRGCPIPHSYMDFGGAEWRSLPFGTVNELGQTLVEWLEMIQREFCDDESVDQSADES
ncbi:MAG: hypothetical protein M1828_005670 [Chrysothrix sp. TS-e1954]|nr:MAG: hypothetical protein M1828_005670 [Chrysothrix sp. TS-e1954]